LFFLFIWPKSDSDTEVDQAKSDTEVDQAKSDSKAQAKSDSKTWTVYRLPPRQREGHERPSRLRQGR